MMKWEVCIKPEVHIQEQWLSQEKELVLMDS